MPFAKLESLLDHSVRKAGIGSKLEHSKLLDEFLAVIAEQFGPAAAAKVKPLYYANGTLTVACLSTPLVNAISAAQRQVLEALNRPYRRKVINQLRFLT